LLLSMLHYTRVNGNLQCLLIAVAAVDV